MTESVIFDMTESVIFDMSGWTDFDPFLKALKNLYSKNSHELQQKRPKFENG